MFFHLSTSVNKPKLEMYGAGTALVALCSLTEQRVLWFTYFRIRRIPLHLDYGFGVWKARILNACMDNVQKLYLFYCFRFSVVVCLLSLLLYCCCCCVVVLLLLLLCCIVVVVVVVVLCFCSSCCCCGVVLLSL